MGAAGGAVWWFTRRPPCPVPACQLSSRALQPAGRVKRQLKLKCGRESPLQALPGVPCTRQSPSLLSFKAEIGKMARKSVFSCPSIQSVGKARARRLLCPPAVLPFSSPALSRLHAGAPAAQQPRGPF